MAIHFVTTITVLKDGWHSFPQTLLAMERMGYRRAWDFSLPIPKRH